MVQLRRKMVKYAMNQWTQLSIDYANQNGYLDALFKVYPTIPEATREIDIVKWNKVETAFNKKDNLTLIKELLSFELFPIKDSYVAYLRKDKSSLEKNLKTITRLSSRLYEMGLPLIKERCSEPKETNRQIGPLFRRWLNRGELGITLLSLDEFASTDKNAILDCADAKLMHFANKYLGYKGEKGLDFVARMNGKYIIGEAKFLTDTGGHQNAQLEDAKKLLRDKSAKAIKIAIADGVLFIKGRNKMYKFITENKEQYTILSSLVLKEFLHQL